MSLRKFNLGEEVDNSVTKERVRSFVKDHIDDFEEVEEGVVADTDMSKLKVFKVEEGDPRKVFLEIEKEISIGTSYKGGKWYILVEVGEANELGHDKWTIKSENKNTNQGK